MTEPFEGQKSTRSETFTLAMPARPIPDEIKHEPHLSETHSTPSTWEDSLSFQRPISSEDAGAPLVPLLPSARRNSENKLAMFLEDSKPLTQ